MTAGIERQVVRLSVLALFGILTGAAGLGAEPAQDVPAQRDFPRNAGSR